MQRDWLGEKVAARSTDPNLCTGFQGNLIARDHKGPAGRDPWLNHATHCYPMTPRSMDLVKILRNKAVEAAKGGLLAASSEPTFWHKPFPLSQYQRLLHTEEKDPWMHRLISNMRSKFGFFALMRPVFSSAG